MQHIQKKLQFEQKDSITDEMFTEYSIFLDIETTGFSPASSSLYLIGCMRRIQDTLLIDKFFAENSSEEPMILQAFQKLSQGYSTILTFHGEGFDIPYLNAKNDAYHIPSSLESFISIDLYKRISSMKALLKLPNYKQKTIESFLGIDRKDLYSGGELIKVYESYTQKYSAEFLSILLLHNFEDVTGMLDLLPMLSYHQILQGDYQIESSKIASFTDYNGKEKKELHITLTNSYHVPKRISCQFQSFYLTIQNNTTKIRVEIFEGELKYFFANYKDYFYLPQEDTAIHKSVAEFIDKSYRERAKSSNCYTRKNSLFLPQYSKIIEPEFKLAHKDKLTYFELTEDFLVSNEKLNDYILHIFRNIPKK